MHPHFPHKAPAEPPLPPMPLYPKATAAATRRRIDIGAAGWISGAAVLLIVIVACWVVYNDNPATGAADRAAVPSAQTGPAVRNKPVEHAPPVADFVPGDGTWLIGKEIKRGTYTSEGAPTCYWSRLSNLSGELEAILANSFKPGPQKVALGPKDVAFESAGCGSWELIP
jgi:hypothetical protein